MMVTFKGFLVVNNYRVDWMESWCVVMPCGLHGSALPRLFVAPAFSGAIQYWKVGRGAQSSPLRCA